MRKHWKFPEHDLESAIELHENLQLPYVICQLLMQRGIQSPGAVNNFLNPSRDQLHDPFEMKDMNKAVDRLQQAIEKKEKILLYGDYDVDGTTAVSLLHRFLQSHSQQLDYYIPDRYKEGYGLSMAGVDYARQNGVALMICLDCGIKAIQQVALANQYGIDVIICDHHLPEAKLPEAIAVLDPKRSDCTYPYKELCGAGVAFKLAQAYTQSRGLDKQKTDDLLDLLVLAIACDIVPLTGENRVLAHLGLLRINSHPRPGLRALIERSNRPAPLTISDIVFGIGPMINAAGRLADARQAVQLLLSDDEQVANNYAHLLHRHNELRKEFDRNIAEEAIALFQQTPGWEDKKSIVLFQAHWHKGVVGIAAARLVERFHRPCIILTESGGMAVGSARSVPGFDIHEAIKACKKHLVNFGGHRHAAGLSLAVDQVADFTAHFEVAVQASISTESLIPQLTVDAELKLADINEKFWGALQRLAPFGPGNRSPVFMSSEVSDAGFSRVLKDRHLRLSVKQADSQVLYGIGFGMGDALAKIQSGEFDLCYTIQENHWEGRRSLQLRVKDLR